MKKIASHQGKHLLPDTTAGSAGAAGAVGGAGSAGGAGSFGGASRSNVGGATQAQTEKRAGFPENSHSRSNAGGAANVQTCQVAAGGADVASRSNGDGELVHGVHIHAAGGAGVAGGFNVGGAAQAQVRLGRPCSVLARLRRNLEVVSRRQSSYVSSYRLTAERQRNLGVGSRRRFLTVVRSSGEPHQWAERPNVLFQNFLSILLFQAIRVISILFCRCHTPMILSTS